jgi:phage gpG-like protein
MMAFTSTVNSESALHGLENFQASLADNSQALAEIAEDLRAQIAEQFATEGAAGGTPWAPLAPSTLRRRHGGGILYDTGALFSSLHDPGAPDHVEENDGTSLLFGSGLPYALFHQTGTGEGLSQAQPPARGSRSRKSPGAGRGRALPMRPLIVVTDARAQSWVDIIRVRLEEKSQLLGANELATTAGQL